jgi:hypothetical protein
MSSAYLTVQQQARNAIAVLTRELRSADNIDSPTTGSDEDVVGATRLNFQIDRGYDVAACGGVCWGNDSVTGGWVHYLLDATDATDIRLVRCESDAADTAIADISACRVLARNIDTFEADYTNSTRTVQVRIEVQETSSQLAGGTVGTTPTPLSSRVRLRNG